MTATLVLVRHGEIIRPPYTSNFDRAPLSRRGEEQIRGLAAAWPGSRPAVVLASALEKKAWADQGYIPPSKESLSQAAVRGTRCLESIATSSDGQTVAVAGHGTLFSLVTASLKGARPSEAYKNSIGFGAAAIVEAGSGLRLTSDFRTYGSVPA